MKTENRVLKPMITFTCLTAIVLGTVLCAFGGARASAWNVDVKPENSTVLLPGPGHGRILIRVDAPGRVLTSDRPPLNLCLVLDKSGSMADAGKMEYALQAAHRLVNALAADDILSIVTYDHRVRTLSRGIYGESKQKLHRIIGGIAPDGRTNLSGGLEEGFRQARRLRRKGYVNRILLLSDGLANVGITDRQVLQRRASVMAENGVSVSTFGMGVSFDEQLLAMMATGGGGSYHYISQPQDIITALNREFSLASSTVATGVEILIRPLGGCRFNGVSGYSWHRDAGNLVIGLGDMSAGDHRSLIASLTVSGQEPGRMEVAEVSMRYRDPATGRYVLRPAERVELELVQDAARFQSGFDDEVVQRHAVIESNLGLEEAARRIDSGDRDGALTVLKREESKLKAAPRSPETESALRDNIRYQDQIQSLGQMAPAEVREMQKGYRYKAYEEIYRK